ncbi:MAG: acetylglutamate kinase [Clostridia bacterium]|nr:acetylglutamate kinase [Clostridia bacterium]
MISNNERASVLVHALPYIQDYAGKIIVVKYGGNAMTDESLKNAVMRDIVLLSLIGVKPVLVHGGGPEISKMLKRVGKESSFVNGLRVTDLETAEIAQMVLAGGVNKSLVALIENIGGRAIGLCGIDGGLMKAKMLDEQLGYVGEITEVDIRPILDLLSRGYIPVISTIGFDAEGNIYNINADTAAARIAGAMAAECMINMTNVPGVLKDKDDPESLIPVISYEEAAELKADGTISGGMIPKVDCCLEALECGVRKSVILDGCIRHSILMEMLTDEGIGTMFTRSKK